jgi:hypothetical protein
VQSVGAICEVPHDVVGRLRTLASPEGNGNTHAGAVDAVDA